MVALAVTMRQYSYDVNSIHSVLKKINHNLSLFNNNFDIVQILEITVKVMFFIKEFRKRELHDSYKEMFMKWGIQWTDQTSLFFDWNRTAFYANIKNTNIREVRTEPLSDHLLDNLWILNKLKSKVSFLVRSPQNG